MAAVNRYHPDATEFVCATCERRHVWAGRRYAVCACGTVAWKFQTLEEWEDAVAGWPMTPRERETWRERQAEREQRLRQEHERQRAELEALMGRPLPQAVTP